MIKALKDLTFADDFMFTHVLTKNKEICKGLLERLLHIEIADIEYPEKEKTFKSGYYSRGIRVDVFVKDSDRIFDIEMQTAYFENLPMRARYYQSMIDENALHKNADYTELKESYIIFICTKDPFGDGKPVYTVEQKFRETGKVYNDKSHKIFYNVSAFSNETDSEIKGFLQFVKTGKANTNFARKIMEAVDYVKMMEEGSYHHYMMVRLHENDLLKRGRKEGIAQGEHNARIATARNLFALGINTPEQIAQATGLSLVEVQALTQ